MELSDKDEKLIGLLRENARLSVSEIARRLLMSRTAVQMRLQKLERNGIIDGYSLRLSPKFLDNRVRALVMIKFPPGNRGGIEKCLSEIPQLTTLYAISGAFDLTAVISAQSVQELDEVIDTIGRLDGILETMSSIILSTKIDR
jgi:DNA-binding Lrp family transcriptional regulator